MPKVILYVKPFCPFCKDAKQHLDASGVEFEERDVIRSVEYFNEMKEKSGQTLAPVMDWNGEILADFGIEELVPFLNKKGIR